MDDGETGVGWVPAETWPQVVESLGCLALLGFCAWLVYKFFSGR